MHTQDCNVFRLVFGPVKLVQLNIWFLQGVVCESILISNDKQR